MNNENEKINQLLAIIATTKPHKIASIQEMLGILFCCKGTINPSKPEEAEDAVHELADNPRTQPLVAIAKAQSISDEGPIVIACDVGMYIPQKNQQFTPLHKPENMESAKQQLSKNFGVESAQFIEGFERPVIPVLGQLAIAIIADFGSSRLPQQMLLVESTSFLLLPFFCEQEIQDYLNKNPNAIHSNSGFLAQSKEMEKRIVAVSDQNGKMVPVTQESYSSLKRLLLGGPRNIEQIKQKLFANAQTDKSEDIARISSISLHFTKFGIQHAFDGQQSTPFSLQAERAQKRRLL